MIAVANLDDARQRINAHQQPGADARRPLQAGDRRARHRDRRRQRLRASRTSLDRDDRNEHGQSLRRRRDRPDARRQSGELTAAQCAGILQRTARPLPGASYKWVNDVGFGRIDPEAAVEEARAANQRTKLR